MNSERPLAILAVEQIAHSLSPSLVRFLHRLALVGVDCLFLDGIDAFGLAARRTAVGKAGLIRLQVEFLRADDALSAWKCHFAIMIQRS
jgi:hypothetical protein